MPCYKPLTAWQSKGKNSKTGKSTIIFSPPSAYSTGWESIQVPCGRCIGCRLERSRQWAVRGMHEAQMHEQNTFITLTFGEWCPLDGTKTDPTKSLYKHHFQRFMKRLRKSVPYKKIRYLHAGEYGEITGRPHHHAILFGHDFSDKVLSREYEKNGVPCKSYKSEQLAKLWPFGLHDIGEVTFESIGYVARYCCKKQENELITKGQYMEDGRLKEYNTMSRGGRTEEGKNLGGIGKQWLDKYGETDVWNHDEVVCRGKVMKPPKYYLSQYELTNPKEYENIKEERIKLSKENPDNSFERLRVREVVKKQAHKRLKRTL